jgi:hypothetical protein
MTQASRFACKCLSNLKKYARKPSRLVDFVDVSKDWEKEPRNIKELIDKGKNGYIKIFKQKLDKEVVRKIYKFEKLKLVNPNIKSLKSDCENQVTESEMDQDYNDFKNENVATSEYLNYFDKRFPTPAYVPEKFLYPRPSDGLF